MENIILIPPNTMHKFIVSEEAAGMRLDVWLKDQFTSYSRTFLKNLIIHKNVIIINKTIIKPRTKIKNGDQITVTFPPIQTKRPEKEIPKELNVEILYEDKHFMIIDKPAGLTVHPPRTNSPYVTLVDWLINKFNEISSVGYLDRPGIVHRLDRETSGIMIVARNNCSHAIFSDIFKNREIQKTYLAIVKGHPEKEGTINFGIKRQPVRRNSMMAVKQKDKTGGKVRSACTNYKILEYFEDSSLVEVKPTTGRTHQIRVHFSAIGHPLIGDSVYGTSSKQIGRHALHAYQLSFKFNGKQQNFCCNLPKDFNLFLKKLRNY